MTDIYHGWHFSDISECLRYGDKRKIEIGVTHTVDCEPKLCESGLHASERIIDALSYAPGPILWKVMLSGRIKRDTDKACATERTYHARIDATEILREFARKCALDVIHLWGAPPIVREYLDSGDGKLANAAADAAQSAARTAARAAITCGSAASAEATYQAADAAKAAITISKAAITIDDAFSVAWAAADSARYAAEAAAWDAADWAAVAASWNAAAAADAARDAAEAASWDAAAQAGARTAAQVAARDAAMAAQNERLTGMVEAEFAKQEKRGNQCSEYLLTATVDYSA